MPQRYLAGRSKKQIAVSLSIPFALRRVEICLPDLRSAAVIPGKVECHHRVSAQKGKLAAVSRSFQLLCQPGIDIERNKQDIQQCLRLSWPERKPVSERRNINGVLELHNPKPDSEIVALA